MKVTRSNIRGRSKGQKLTAWGPLDDGSGTVYPEDNKRGFPLTTIDSPNVGITILREEEKEREVHKQETADGQFYVVTYSSTSDKLVAFGSPVHPSHSLTMLQQQQQQQQQQQIIHEGGKDLSYLRY